MTLERVYKLPLVLEPQPEGGYTITCPLLPNLITEADTLDQVQANVADALAALIEMYEDLGKPLPPALPGGGAWTALCLRDLLESGSRGTQQRT
jgi:antitoxin HicB